MSPVKPYPPKQPGKESWVYRIASAMAGHPITHDEADKFTSSDINGFIHQQIRITVSETAPKENGKRYNNIDSFLAVKQQLPLFDEKNVPQPPQAAPELPQANQNQSGREKAQAVANSLPGGNRPVETVLGHSRDGDEINLEDVPV